MNSDNSCTTDSSDDERHSRRVGKYVVKGKLHVFTPRPHASPGYWLCCLLPLALSTVLLKRPAFEPGQSYGTLVVGAIGMGVESLCFYAYMFLSNGLPLDLCISCLPALLTTLLFRWLQQRAWLPALILGFGITFSYQKAYVRVMRELPCCFSYGECAIFVQGLMLFLLNTWLQLPGILFGALINEQGDIFNELAGIMLFALTCLYLVNVLLYRFACLRGPAGFYPLLLILAVVVTCAPITQPLPIVKVLDFIFNDRTRCLTVYFYASLVVLTVCTVWWQLRPAQKASTCVRKIFHLLIVLVYVPGVLYECAFIFIASGVAFAIFCVLEIMRLMNVPPLGATLKTAFATFADEKDSGLLALTPFSLLIGCSLPLWISPCACSTQGTYAYSDSLLSLLSGVLTVGFGDAAASVLGSKFGRVKWHNSRRSIEGTTAFICVVLLAVLGLNTAGYTSMSQGKWFVTIQATLVTALVEAHTDQIDNLVLPLVFYIIVSLV